MNSDQQEQIHKARADLVKSDMEAWKFLLEFHRISDQDIYYILNPFSNKLCDEDIAWRKIQKSADDARRAILKIYSYETPLYSAVNRAN